MMACPVTVFTTATSIIARDRNGHHAKKPRRNGASSWWAWVELVASQTPDDRWTLLQDNLPLFVCRNTLRPRARATPPSRLGHSR
jgi:hypothetical protein